MTHNCGPLATCSDSAGSFSCFCNRTEFSVLSDNLIDCLDTDECALGTHICSQYGSCNNTIGSYSCSCNAGYQGTGLACDDSNECLNGDHNCDTHASCKNTFGSFRCCISCTHMHTCADRHSSVHMQAPLVACVQQRTRHAALTWLSLCCFSRRCWCKAGYFGSGVACEKEGDTLASPMQCTTDGG
jgi:hypothetical protein